MRDIPAYAEPYLQGGSLNRVVVTSF